ncbi:MAG: YbjN domain-containing protein [Bacteroidales bacterium]
MDANYKNFIAYLQANEIRFEDNEKAKLVRFGYNIDMGTIEIVVDFEHEKRIGFFSFLNMNVTESRKYQALELLNSFNESLNYGSIIISQTTQIVYKIMYTTFDNEVQDDQWAEMIFRLWSISRDIYPLFGRLIFTSEDAKSLFEEFLRSKEKLQGVDHQPASQPGEEAKGNNGNVTFWKDFRDWYLQN